MSEDFSGAPGADLKTKKGWTGAGGSILLDDTRTIDVGNSGSVSGKYARRIMPFTKPVDSLGEAARFAQAFGAADGIAKKLAAVMDARFAPYLKMLSPHLPAGRALAFVMVAEISLEAFDALVAAHGGTVTLARDADAAAAALPELSVTRRRNLSIFPAAARWLRRQRRPSSLGIDSFPESISLS